VRVALIANAASGSGLDPEPLVRAMEAHAADVEVFGCEEGELERASRREPERLVVAGGDGTVASVADLAGRLDVPLGVIPGGTAYARWSFRSTRSRRRSSPSAARSCGGWSSAGSPTGARS
jgi:diacylglycerol kinase family enzyme